MQDFIIYRIAYRFLQNIVQKEMSNEWNKIVANNPLLHTLFVDNSMEASTEKSYCRLCADYKAKDKMIDIQMDSVKKTEITTKLSRINAFTDFEIETLPRTVCLLCVEALDKAYDLVNIIERAQSVLKDIVVVRNIKKEALDSDDDSAEVYSAEPTVTVKTVQIKIETEGGEGETLVGKSKTASRKSQKNNKSSSLSAIPLAQLKLTWNNYDWTCSYCETQFPDVEELKIHSMQYHGSCNAYKCTDCNRRKLRLDSFMIHVKRHKKYLKLSCYKCFERFHTARETNAHKKEHLTSNHVCLGCNTCFETEEEMARHSTIFYKPKRAPQNFNTIIDNDGLTCMLCKKTFKYRGNLNTHLLKHTERNREHTCDKCGKTFLSKHNLAGHMLVHSDVRPYQCEICKQAFKTPQQLRSHVGVHDGQKPYSCDQCGRCFRLHRQLISHSIIHTDLLPHVCSYCNKRFRFKTILNQHIRQHTGVKPYSCDVCHRDFTNWPNYNKHMKGRHNMDMAKKKHTPDGLYPINPVTGEVIIYPETNKTLEWKRKMMAQRRPGRPKVPKVDETPNTDVIRQEEIVIPVEMEIKTE